MKKKKLRLIIFLLILFISIGFAYLSTNLSLFGTGIFKQNSWDIYFDNITEETYKSEVIGTTEIDNKTTINFSVNLDSPGSTYTMYANIVNDGSIDAMLDSWNLTNTMDENEAKAIDIKVTYSDGVEFTKNDLLKAKSFDTIKVVVTYKKSISNNELLTSEGDLDFSLTMNYVQADEDGLEREQGWENKFSTNPIIITNNGGTTHITLDTSGGWELVYKRLNLEAGQRYKLSFDYEILRDYEKFQNNPGIGLQIIKSSELGSSNMSSIQNVLKHMSLTTGKYSESLEFTATPENYFVINNGMANDNQTIEYTISNFKIEKIS